MTKSKIIYIRKDDEDRFSFSFFVRNDTIQRQFNLNRPVQESTSQFLQRLRSNLEKVANKKMKKKKKKNENKKQENCEGETEEEEKATLSTLAELFRDGKPIDENDGAITEVLSFPDLEIQIFGEVYVVDRNPPVVETLKLCNQIMVGFPVYPSKYEILFGSKEASQFLWYISPGDSQKNFVWTQKTHEDFFYTPTSEDVGKYLKLVVIPRNGDRVGLEAEVISENPIQAGPGVCPFETRHVFTRTCTAPDVLRVVSYNLLADLYADSDFSRTVLHPQCPPYALAFDYRKQLILKELLGYNADIICLQEVDRKNYKWDLYPVLSAFGFDGVFETKGGELAEGMACFYRTSKFELLDSSVMIMSELLKSNKEYEDLAEKIASKDALNETFMKLKTAFLSVNLRSRVDPLKTTVVGVTHLYFKPDADHIRLLQTEMCLRNLRQKCKDALGATCNNVSLIFCGDFNSVPSNGVYEYARTGFIDSDHADWKSCPGQEVEGLAIKHDFHLDSACGTPKYTNYTIQFKDCLDYIFYDRDNFEVEQVIPFPSEEELSLHTAIPNVVFPSDHIACVADLKIK